MSNDINIELHFYLSKPGVHTIDAHVHNECERSLILALDALKKYIGEYDILVKAKNEGGIIDNILLTWGNDALETCANLFVGAFLSYWFSKKIKKHEIAASRFDILDRIKTGKYTKDEALTIIGTDRQLKKLASNYYSTIEKEPQVSKITISASTNNKQLCESSIEKPDFGTRILEEQISQKSQTIESTTIRIISPVLSGQGKVWQGVYSGEKIKFKIEDKDFIKQVHNNEIKFGANTTITCRLKITKKFKDGEHDGEPEYTVEYVSHWADDNSFQNETKKYKKIKEDKRQLSLFDNNE